MNKKGSFWIWVIIIIVVIWLIISLIKGAFFWSVNTINNNECPKGIIPDKIVLYQHYGAGSFDIVLDVADSLRMMLLKSPKINNVWGDGKEIYSHYGETGVNDCHIGKREGENINYIYCDRLIYENYKTDISQTGVIGKTNVIKYNVVLLLPRSSQVNATATSQLYENYFLIYDIESVKCYKTT